ncbi:hypothetical protein G9U51_00855 [Calidifontibacter sp. DB0510]|uniref:Uncharacterized protein n=1 Tax=Metallococcus carri TaxID=1656884 RepID=A0A967E8Z5_9MICO|nr:hypothetical protein [Metallococcus carri]NHN54334.1 hypothetical protein [Metallococcus carri]NOP36826.1 hypothetical protein [Calidifontibacter sp. DB2511S]
MTPSTGQGTDRGRRGRAGAGQPDVGDAGDWFTGRLPKDWFSDVEVTADREEITVVGTLTEQVASGAEAEGAVARWRADTKAERIGIAQEAEQRFQRKVSWGVRLGESRYLFTHVAAPVMTRLRQPERQVLDTLVDAGVARSRSDALAWCVRLSGEHLQEWLDKLRDAMTEVEKLRAEGPPA